MPWHNVEESVLVFAGEATAAIGDERFDLVAGEVTWVPADIPHCSSIAARVR